MSDWIAPQMAPFPEDIMDDKEGGSWGDFRELVRKNCGAYLKSQGVGNIRDIIDLDFKVNFRGRRSRVAEERKKVNEFFERLEEERRSAKGEVK